MTDYTTSGNEGDMDTSTVLGWAILSIILGAGLYSIFSGQTGGGENIGSGDPLGVGSTMVVAEDTVESDSLVAGSTMTDSEQRSTADQSVEGGSASGNTERADPAGNKAGAEGGGESSSGQTVAAGESGLNPDGNRQSDGRKVDRVREPETYTPPQERVNQFYNAIAAQADRWDRQLDALHQDAERSQDELDQVPTLRDTGTDKLTIGLGDSRKDQYDDTILNKAKEYEIDPLALKVIISQESNFRRDARAESTTAAGLCQVVAPTFRDLYPQFKDFSDAWIEKYLMKPEHAIDAGAKYYAEKVLPNTNGDLRRIFYQYYLGHAAIESMIKPGPNGPVIESHKDDAARYAQDAVEKYRTWADRLNYTYSPGKSRSSGSVRR